jgi:ubiquinone/menaquinone biosynthesis C-methylase UbiE
MSSLRSLAKKWLPPVVRETTAWRAVSAAARELRFDGETPSKQPAVPEPPKEERAVTPAEYWTLVNVTAHRRFSTAEASLDDLDWRNGQYYGYLERMPVAGHDGKRILDYGCGPGYDVLGFGLSSKPARLVGVDVSPTSLAEAKDRLALHGVAAELVQIREDEARLPFEDASFDYIASSGVLHHVPDPVRVLRDLRRVLKPGGELRVMVYNRASVFFHLYVAYQVQIEEGRFADMSLEDAFRRLTDGENCPISHCYSIEAFAKLAEEAGLVAEHLGNAVSAFEMSLLPKRHLALINPKLPKEQREFLRNLTFDERELPLSQGVHAGVDGCYRLHAANGR